MRECPGREQVRVTSSLDLSVSDGLTLPVYCLAFIYYARRRHCSVASGSFSSVIIWHYDMAILSRYDTEASLALELSVTDDLGV